ncbi:ANTAR domain-containing protein [Streptomyces sp. NPDC059582]|uniref:ANTAR domain-containing protein n=1 Tax=Streptomyces sp. NPDC059582 TaxID=3346875 RepID=UPI0036AF3E81
MPDRELSPQRVDGDVIAWSPWLQTVTYAAGDRIVAETCGEIDIDTEQVLRQALGDALDRSVTGVDLDLTAVAFCDCSGLNALLRIRRLALAEGKTLALQATSPAVERLLTMTGTRCLFSTLHPAGPQDETRTPHSLATRRPAARSGNDGTAHDLRAEVEQLRRAMLTRPVIDLARGVLMATFRLSPEDAWGVLVRVSQRTNTKLHLVAEDVLGSIDGHSLSEHMQQQLAAAVRNPAASPAAAHQQLSTTNSVEPTAETPQ